MRKFLIIPLFLLLIWGGYSLYHHIYFRYLLTDLILPYSLEDQWTSPSRPEDLEQILGQHYSYLGQGAQAYGFLSNDGRYVLKIFHYKHYKNEAKRSKLVLNLQGYALAYEKIPKESGIIFQQLTPGQGPIITVNLSDRLGMEHSIPLQDVRYVIQKYVIPSGDMIALQFKEGKTVEAQANLSKLLHLVDMESSLGIYDKDLGLLHNTGFLDGELIHYDLGKLTYDPEFCRSDSFGIHKESIQKRLVESERRQIKNN